MKTSVGKVLSVVTAVASVIFLGFVMIASMGGHNWVAEAQSVEGFSVTQTDAAPRKWTASQHVGGATIAPNDAIEPVLLGVYDAKLKAAEARKQSFESQIAPLEQAISVSQSVIETDLKALDDESRELAALLAETESEIAATAEQVEAKAEEVRKVELQIQSRREDVVRLLRQVEEIRSDRFRISVVRQQLQDLIQQIDRTIERSANRQQQLQERGRGQDAIGRAAPAPSAKS